MHKLPIKYLRPGMIVAQGIYHTNGLFLLTKGTRLTDEYIKRLKILGIATLYVTSSDVSLKIPPPSDVIKEKTRLRAIKDVFDTFKNYQLKNRLDVELLDSTVTSIIHDLSDSKNKLAQISDIRLHDNYTFSHSVNVAVLATMLGKQLNLSKNHLCELTLGALLHDIGKIKISNAILNKPSILSPAEAAIIQQHPNYGYDILSADNKFSDNVMRICQEHHEKFDGTGYPNKLTGEKIHKFAKIVAVADVYDALTSERSYKKAYLPYLAYNLMVKCSSGHFDPNLLELFFKKIAIYPVGTILKLSTGYAIVKKVPIANSLFPIVVQFADNNKQRLKKHTVIALYKNPQIRIHYELAENDITDLLQTLKIDPAIFIAEVKS